MATLIMGPYALPERLFVVGVLGYVEEYLSKCKMATLIMGLQILPERLIVV
jgi:hypothetical protein